MIFVFVDKTENAEDIFDTTMRLWPILAGGRFTTTIGEGSFKTKKCLDER